MNLPNFSFSELCEAIYDVVSAAALQIEPFSKAEDGTIRITARPLCNAANVWLTPDTKRPHLHSIVERSFSIQANGKHAIIKDGDQISTYGYSALKTATCMDLVQSNLSMNSLNGLEPNIDKIYAEDCGYSLHYGSLCVVLNSATDTSKECARLDSDGRVIDDPFAEIYICVSGGFQMDDAACAWEAIPLIDRMFTEDNSHVYVAKHPYTPFQEYLQERRGIYTA